jgi:hypothetical protein
MDKIKEFLGKLISDSSDVSAMRVMAFTSLLTGIGLAIGGLYRGSDLSQLSVLVGVFVGAAFGGKVTQKFAEMMEKKE